MLTTKLEKDLNKFQTSLEYLSEYRGVKSAVIFDSDGLVVVYIDRDSLTPDVFSPLALLMVEQTNSVLEKLNEKPLETMIVKTSDSWLTIKRINNLILVVKAENKTDELLKVRINQAVDMIKSHLKDSYPFTKM